MARATTVDPSDLRMVEVMVTPIPIVGISTPPRERISKGIKERAKVEVEAKVLKVKRAKTNLPKESMQIKLAIIVA